MTVQDLPKFAAFEEWGLQLAPGKKPKAKHKTQSSTPPPIAVEMKRARVRLLALLLRVGRWIADAAREEAAEWFRGLRRKIITALIGLLGLGGGAGVAHQEFDLFGWKHEAPPPVAANDNSWKTEVHRAPRTAARGR